MSTEIVNSYNIFVDSERNVPVSSDGSDLTLSLNQTPIHCDDNQYIRLTLQSFSMYKSFTNVNPNNNVFRIRVDPTSDLDTTKYDGTNGTGVLEDFKIALDCQNYGTRLELARQFMTKIGEFAFYYTGIGRQPGFPNITPDNSGTGDNIISSTIVFSNPHLLTEDNFTIRFMVEDGDIFELLGGDRLYPGDTTGVSITLDYNPDNLPNAANSTKLKVTCRYNAQLSTQQNVYLRTDISNTNIQTDSFNAFNTDNKSDNLLSNSKILARLIIDNEFIVFTSGTQMEFFLNLQTKNLTHMRLHITDSHGREIPANVKRNTAIAHVGTAGFNQPTDANVTEKSQGILGSRSFEAVIKVDVVQHMGGHNRLMNTEFQENPVAPRFTTHPMQQLNHGKSGYPDRVIRQNKNVFA